MSILSPISLTCVNSLGHEKGTTRNRIISALAFLAITSIWSKTFSESLDPSKGTRIFFISTSSQTFISYQNKITVIKKCISFLW